MTEALVVRDLHKSYGLWKKNPVLKGVSFEIKSGRCCGLLGPNGAGKTTLIKIILGLVRPDQGNVSIWGQSSFSQSLRYRVGFLPEESYLYSFLTIAETMDLAIKLYGNSDTLRLRSKELLHSVQLDQVLGRKISECSKGMKRRVAFAQALLHDPDLIILDEPTSGFDPMGMAMMKEIIRELHSKGKSILICSHQLKEVQDLCQDVVILNRGESIAQGELSRLVPDSSWGVEVYSECDQQHIWNLVQKEGLNGQPFVHADLEQFFIKSVSSHQL